MLFGSYVSALTAKPSLLTIEALTESRLLAFPYKQRGLEDCRRSTLAMGMEERMAGLLMKSPEER